jgi:transcriptional regulator with XRE-family HTH domain
MGDTMDGIPMAFIYGEAFLSLTRSGDQGRRRCIREVDVMGMAQPVTFGQLLKRYRMAARMSQETLAERSGLAVRSISDLERDVRRLPHPDTIQRLAAALPLSPQDQAALVAAARRSGAASPAPLIDDNPASVLTPFVGRTEEMGRLARFLARQESPMLFFGGEPGIGKSRLLREAAARAEATRLAGPHWGVYTTPWAGVV